MTNDKMRVAIAESCGWVFVPSHDVSSPMGYNQVAVDEYWLNPDGDIIHDALLGSNELGIPNYPEDLDAMAEVEKTIKDDNSMHGLVAYCNMLMKVCGSHRACVTATAKQRAESYLRMIGKFV